jgi:excisionase family DNA binding protein
MRAGLSPDSLVSLDEAASLLPGRARENALWLENAVAPQCASILGAPLLLWGEVARAFGLENQDGRERSLIHDSSTEEDRLGARAAACVQKARYNSQSRWVGAKEAARLLGVSERKLRSLLRDGALDGASMQIGRAWRVDPQAAAEALRPRREEDGVAQESKKKEKALGTPGDVLVDQLPGRARQNAPEGDRLRRYEDRQGGSEGVRSAGATRPEDRTGSGAYLAFLING